MTFEQIVDELEKTLPDKPLEERIEKINEVCEDHVKRTGKKPDSYQLTRLSNLILLEDLKNKDSHKTQKSEYPFHSAPQAKRRRKKEFVTQDDTLDFMNFKKKAKLSTAPPKDNH